MVTMAPVVSSERPAAETVVRREATMFSQFLLPDGSRQLRSMGPLHLADGRTIDDSLVSRTKQWTESLRAVDWNGDGRMGLVYSMAGGGEVYLLKNVGADANEVKVSQSGAN